MVLEKSGDRPQRVFAHFGWKCNQTYIAEPTNAFFLFCILGMHVQKPTL